MTNSTCGWAEHSLAAREPPGASCRRPGDAAVEYYNAEHDQYFVTTLQSEMQALDARESPSPAGLG